MFAYLTVKQFKKCEKTRIFFWRKWQPAVNLYVDGHADHSLRRGKLGYADIILCQQHSPIGMEVNGRLLVFSTQKTKFSHIFRIVQFNLQACENLAMPTSYCVDRGGTVYADGQKPSTP
jgi:hypothetical protein